jgi:hypothetical protein
MEQIHKNLTQERWQKLSIPEQLANIGSEASRAFHWREAKDKEEEKKSFYRILELIDISINDPKWKGKFFELLRLREILCDFFAGENNYNTSVDVLENYFLSFALLSRKDY